MFLVLFVKMHYSVKSFPIKKLNKRSSNQSYVKMGELLESVLLQIDLLALNIESLESADRGNAMMMFFKIISNIQDTCELTCY